jgi:hypothetical protein
MPASATLNKKGEWSIPQVYYVFHGNGKTISRQKLLEKINNNALLQEAMQIDPRIKNLVEEAKKERCVPGYNANGRFYTYYKPQIVSLVGWECSRKELRSQKYYDAVYEAVYELLPGDEWDIYPDAIMPNGMFCPTWQEKRRESTLNGGNQ